MGLLIGGILGNVKGKVGAVCGSVLGGQNVIKAMPASYDDKKSVSQIAQRSSFANSLTVFKSLRASALNGFVERLAKHSAYNAFMASNINIGADDAGTVFSGLVVSKGSLSSPAVTMEATTVSTVLNFSWTNDADGSAKLATDKIHVIGIDRATGTVIYDAGSATRATGSVSLPIPAALAAATIETYVFATRADGSKASNSLRTGWAVPGSDLAGSVQ